MKKLFTFFSFFLITSLSFAQFNPNFFEMRLTIPGGLTNVMHMQMRAISTTVPTTDDFCTDLGFRLHWNTAAITSIDMVQSTSLGMSLNEQAVVPGSGNNKTQTIGFCATCGFFNFPANWVVNQWVNIGTININGTGSAADFDFVGFDGQFPNIEVTFEPHTPNVGALPLNLIAFNAYKSGERNAHVTWTTANEENTSHFIVQRSLDLKTWSDVGTVAAAGYSIDIRNYELNDFDVYNGLDSRLQVHYRLVMVDLDGRSKLSPIKSVIFGNTSSTNREFLVYPNPASNGVYVEWDVDEFSQPTALELYTGS